MMTEIDIKTKRVFYWDNLKFALMLLVVLYHYRPAGETAARIIDEFFGLFHMPLFIFVSGIFHKNERVRDRAISLIIVGTVYNIFLYIIDTLVLGMQLEFYIFKATKAPWFTFALAICSVVTYMLRDCNKRVCMIIALLIGCFAGYDAIIVGDVILAKTLIWYPFYYAGWLLHSRLSEGVIAKKQKVCVGGGICFGIIVILTVLLAKTKFSILNYLYLFIGTVPNVSFMERVIYYIIVVIVSAAFMCLIPNRELRFISKWGTRTLQVYFWHIPIRSFVDALHIREMVGNSYRGIFAYTCGVILLDVILSTKIFAFPTNYLVNAFKTIHRQEHNDEADNSSAVL